MVEIKKLHQGLAIYKALSSDTRVAIVELLAKQGPMRMTSIAEALEITGGAITTHMKLLSDAGVVVVEQTKGRHGVQKICRATDSDILIKSPFSNK